MPEPGFCHLHVHTHYSLLDGACKIGDLIKRAKQLGMGSIAITDHGALFGVVEFFTECTKEGIKPILGMEAYMAPGSRSDRSLAGGQPGEAAYHLLLLCENLQGYQNLMKLSSTAYKDGFYYKPRIDKDVLRELKGGLIATSACLGGEIPSALLKRDAKTARRIAETYLDIFGPDRFFIEIQKQGIKEQDEVNPELVEIARKLGCGVVATNDVHFLTREDHFAHDVLCCISMGRLITDENRLKYPTELYLKSPEEMRQALGEFPEAIANTMRIASMCELQIDTKKRYAPVYKVPADKLNDAYSPVWPLGSHDDEKYLRQLCEEGLIWRYGTRDVDRDIRERLDKELKVIVSKNFCSYFLIVWDFCNYARANGIPVGARGSGVGTMVGYLLGLCNVDPIRYGLLFERFMDPSRNEMPDIDIDICQDGRQQVIEYVRQKYGHVAQIVSFNTLGAKAACKDVARVLGVPLPEVDKLTKLIPGTPNITLGKAIAQVPDLDKLYREDPTVKRVIDIAKRLEGMCRNTGIHAAGVIIADQPIENIAPLYKTGDDILTQFEGPIAEKVGLLKMDFLGLRTLSVIKRAVDLVKQTKGIDVDIEKIDLTDRKVLDLFCRGETKGIFQFESGGMADLLIKMHPDRIEDLIAANALYRPGPMELIPSYCNRKHGREPVPTVHPTMDNLLAETYGVMTYQEQVMQIFNQLGGIELANAYKLIKAISKKNVETIAKFKPDFISGTMAKGVTKEGAEEIFDLILKFGGYGFNKCVVAETSITDANTGEQTTVGDLFRNRHRFTIHALGDDGKLHARRVEDVVWNGRKPVYELRTAQGRRITATANHPFRTLNGWTVLDELRPGDRIASPRHLHVTTNETWAQHELIALAGLLSEGNTCHPTCLYFFGNDEPLVRDFAQAVEVFPDTVARVYHRDERRMEVCVSTGRDARFRKGQHPWNWQGNENGVAVAERVQAPARSGAFRWAKSLDIVGRKATEKRIPAEVFALREADIELFLGRLWAGDGFIANNNLKVPFYATSSLQLARDVQTLLLRLGIISGIHAKSFRYRGGQRPGYTVHVLGEHSIERFIRSISPHCLGRERQAELLAKHVRSTTRGLTSKDTIPADVRKWVDDERRQARLTWDELERQSGVSMKEFVGNGSRNKRGFRRTTIARLALFFRSQRLWELAESDIFWDRVVSIEPKGIQDTYDLTVADDHNFVADGLIVHNSHSTRYAFVAFQTAYLKVYHPVEYMAALLTYEMGSTDKVVEYIEECRRMTLADGTRGLRVLPPDVNSSDRDFTPIYLEEGAPARGRKKAAERKKAGVIRFGLCAVRGVGGKAVEAIIEQRQAGGPFTSLFDFCERVDLRQVTKSTIDALIKCGAFAGLHARRSQLLHVLDRAVEMGQQAQQDKRMGQLSMFAAGAPQAGAPRPADPLPEVDELPNADLLKFEKELLGFYITSHPLTEHQAAIERYSTASTRDAGTWHEGTELTIGGMINRVKKTITKNGRSAGQNMAMVTLEDLEGQIDGVCFAETYAEIMQKYPNAVTAESIVFVKGKVDKRRETPSLIVSEMLPVTEAPARLTTAVVLKIDPTIASANDIAALKPVLEQNKGNVPVFLQVSHQNQLVTIRTSMGVRVSTDLVADLEMALGGGNVILAGAGSKRQKRLAQQPLFQGATTGDDGEGDPQAANGAARGAPADDDALIAQADLEPAGIEAGE